MHTLTRQVLLPQIKSSQFSPPPAATSPLSAGCLPLQALMSVHFWHIDHLDKQKSVLSIFKLPSMQERLQLGCGVRCLPGTLTNAKAALGMVAHFHLHRALKKSDAMQDHICVPPLVSSRVQGAQAGYPSCPSAPQILKPALSIWFPGNGSYSLQANQANGYLKGTC